MINNFIHYVFVCVHVSMSPSPQPLGFSFVHMFGLAVVNSPHSLSWIVDLNTKTCVSERWVQGWVYINYCFRFNEMDEEGRRSKSKFRLVRYGHDTWRRFVDKRIDWSGKKGIQNMCFNWLRTKSRKANREWDRMRQNEKPSKSDKERKMENM